MAKSGMIPRLFEVWGPLGELAFLLTVYDNVVAIPWCSLATACVRLRPGHPLFAITVSGLRPSSCPIRGNAFCK